MDQGRFTEAANPHWIEDEFKARFLELIQVISAAF